MNQLYYDIARGQWNAWEQRRRDWWRERWGGADRGVRPDRKPEVWRELEAIMTNLFYWREIAAPHHSASRYVAS